MQAPYALPIKVVLPLAKLVRGQSRYAVAFCEDCLSRRAHVGAEEIQLDGLTSSVRLFLRLLLLLMDWY